MSMVLAPSQLEQFTPTGLASEDQVRRQVWTVLAGLYPPRPTVERRFAQRFPYPQLLYLTPVGSDGVTAEGDSVVVVGKHLSERGLGFFYQQPPFPHRRAIASLEIQNGGWAGFLIEIIWCRFTRHGWYDSGGRFLQSVPSPIAARESERAPALR
jgi:hypothetical protein